MNLLASMLRTHPTADPRFRDEDATIAATLERCAIICTSCADACLAEAADLDHLARCIRLNQDCADICGTAARIVIRQTHTPGEIAHAVLHACSVACQACAEECRAHADMHDHCRICADTCHQCQERCNFLMGETSSSGIADETNRPDETSTS